MKTIFKYISIPLVIISLLLSCISFSAFADSVEGSTSVGSPEEFMTDYGESTSYLWYKYIESETDTKRVYTFVYTPLPDDIEYSESGDIISFTASNKSRQRGYDYSFKSGNYGLKYNSQPSIYNFSVNVSEKTVNGQVCEAVILCINGTIYDSNALNVEVSFSPELVGVVDREINNNGTKSYLSELKMTVINHCSYPIQYKMDITAKNQTNSRPSGSTDYTTYYDDDAVFKYYSESWVWNKSGTFADSSDDGDLGNVWSDVPFKFNKASEWHYLSSRSTHNQTFKFSQINLREGVEYTVTVYACPSLVDSATENFTSDSSDVNEYTLDSSTVEIVYQSDFSMLHYSDVVYNPNDDSNGVVPYNGYDGSAPSHKYDSSYNAWESLDGQQDFKGYDGYPSYNGNITVRSDGQYTSLVSRTSGVFLFFRSIMNFFPSDVFIVLNLTLWSILILAIVRRLS